MALVIGIRGPGNVIVREGQHARNSGVLDLARRKSLLCDAATSCVDGGAIGVEGDWLTVAGLIGVATPEQEEQKSRQQRCEEESAVVVDPRR
jgi:hypothetical protein